MQKNPRFFVAACLAAVAVIADACSDSIPTSPALPQPQLSRSVADSMQALHKKGIVRAGKAFDGTATTSPAGAMQPHSNSILSYTNTYAIFAGPAWNTDPYFTNDKITAIQSFFQGFGASGYAKVVTEYGATTQSSFVGTYVDNGNPPDGNPYADYVGPYVCSFIGAHGLSADPNAVYMVYSTDAPWPIDQYSVALGWHSASNCGGVTIHYGIVANLDGRNDVTDTQHYHSDNAAALANTTAHELMETITDAVPGSGWFVQNTGGEIGDKCNFSFGPSPYVTLANGAVFKLQGEWSNRAFNESTGFANGNSPPEYGCVKTGFYANVGGPTFTGNFEYCTWTAYPDGGVPPYTYSWEVHSWLGNGELTWYPNTGSGSTFTSEMYTYNHYDRGYVHLRLTDATGNVAATTYNITWSNAGGC